MTKYRRGFKQQAETTAEELRAELGVKNIDRLDPLQLATHLLIPVMPLTALTTLGLKTPDIDEAVNFLRASGRAELSAVTVLRGRHRLVIHNDAHDAPRQASDLTHELAHGILLHPPAPAFDDGGCRDWDSDIEAEAAYLSGALLVPGKAARWLAKAQYTAEQGAERFGCSKQMIDWRLNESGARRLLNK